MMNSQCFVEQTGTEELLERVGRYCAECFSEFVPGERIYYDMNDYRYLCGSCAETLSEKMDERCEIVEDEGGSLF
ncbi:hypothetical protein [Nitratifractor sp.]